ncbi:MAG: DUF429 domain-containing protein [Myxococcota bacterium]
MMPFYRRIVGIDMAVDRRSVAVGRATYRDEDATFHIDELVRGSSLSPAADTDDRLLQTVKTIAPVIARMIDGPTLLAMDSPLGWPVALGACLADHTAGQPLDIPLLDRDRLFVRRTDRALTTRFGHAGIHIRPLEVGADRIARTAQAALALLHEACPRAVLWWPGESPPFTGLVETYPAATLAAIRGRRAQGYKGNKGGEARAVLFDTLVELSGPGHHHVDRSFRDDCIESDHALDAVLCALGGIDVAVGRARGPREVDAALRREGWIWVRDP